jgi:hypothetical protein
MIQVKNKVIISLDSLSHGLESINNTLLSQNITLINELENSQKMIQQLKISNLYKAHENDFVIDDNVFENDDIT